MRVIRLEIKENVKELLREINLQFRTGDKGFVEDIYSLMRLKGSGLPSKQRADKLTTYLATQAGINPVSARIMMNKRMQVLKQMTQMAYFKALSTMPDPIDAVRRMFINFQSLYFKYREAQCRTCPLLAKCDFGAQYKNMTTNIAKVIDPDWEKKINSSCPSIPQLEIANQLSEAMERMKQMAQQQGPEAELAGVPLDEKAEEDAEEEAFDSSCDDNLDDIAIEAWEEENLHFADPLSKGGDARFHAAGAYSGSHTGENYVRHFEEMINKLTAQKLVIFELGQKFGLALTEDKSGHFSPVDEMSQDKKEEKIETESDVPKVLPSQLALPDHLFEKRLAERSLEKKQDLKRIQKKKLLYLLIDQSFSMTARLTSNRFGMMTRGGLSVIFSMALCRRVRDDGGMIFVRFFSTSPASRLTAKVKDDFDPLMRLISHANFNAGGTNILNAVSAAMRDITNAKDEVAKAEIILISDCEDSFSPQGVIDATKGVELNVLDVSGDTPGGHGSFHYDGSKSLKAVAKNYHRVDLSAPDISQIVKIV